MNKLAENYEAPMVEVIEVEVEMGFAVSGGIDEAQTSVPGFGSTTTW